MWHFLPICIYIESVFGDVVKQIGHGMLTKWWNREKITASLWNLNFIKTSQFVFYNWWSLCVIWVSAVLDDKYCPWCWHRWPMMRWYTNWLTCFFLFCHAALLWSSHHHLLQCCEAAMVNGQQRECAESGEGGEVSVWHCRLLDYVGTCIHPSF